jgi:hypothetical protein
MDILVFWHGVCVKATGILNNSRGLLKIASAGALVVLEAALYFYGRYLYEDHVVCECKLE